jgi:hypothetical protein
MARRVFQDPELGKFTWSSIMLAWEGRFKLDKQTEVGLNIGGDPDEGADLAQGDLAKAMPKVKKFLELIRKKAAAWAQQAYQQVGGEIDEYVEMCGFDPSSDAEVIEGDPTPHEIDVEVSPKLAVSGSVRYSLQVLLGGTQTLDYWITVTLDGRGRYKEAALTEG